MRIPFILRVADSIRKSGYSVDYNHRKILPTDNSLDIYSRGFFTPRNPLAVLQIHQYSEWRMYVNKRKNFQKMENLSDLLSKEFGNEVKIFVYRR